MELNISEDYIQEIHSRMHATCSRMRLPLRNTKWKGFAGNWAGVGIGSSIDFQDYRTYVPGDDPRYIDWKAYGRTGNYIMKLYREEVSPKIDLVLDISESMFLNEAKKQRTLELFYFIAESALQSMASLRCYLISGDKVTYLENDSILGHHWLTLDLDTTPKEALNLGQIDWRRNSFSILISDLLYPESPYDVLIPILSAQGQALILCPFSKDEESPDWRGNVKFIDCESQNTRRDHISDSILKNYNQSYIRHFAAWKEFCTAHSVNFARVPSESDFYTAVQHEALASGAIELCS